MPEPAAPAPAAPVAARKPGFYEAVAIYERGVQALQRHDYDGAAGFFRTILDRYPDERELLERARLYLRVCERETARQPTGPKTPAERVYAATVALNSGDHTAPWIISSARSARIPRATTRTTSWPSRSGCAGGPTKRSITCAAP